MEYLATSLHKFGTTNFVGNLPLDLILDRNLKSFSECISNRHCFTLTARFLFRKLT